MSARYTDTGTEIHALPPISPTVQLPPMTAAELFIIRTALESASLNAADEEKESRRWSGNEDLEDVDRRLALIASVKAGTRSREYAALAMRLGQIQSTLPALGALPAGWEGFPS